MSAVTAISRRFPWAALPASLSHQEVVGAESRRAGPARGQPGTSRSTPGPPRVQPGA